MNTFWFKDFLLGLILILIGFYCGAQENIVFAMLGFIACFVIGVTIIVEGWKKKSKQAKMPEENHG